jgi:hypothetical protein
MILKGFLTLAAALALSSPSVFAEVLWYNGDSNGSGLFDFNSNVVYDDFIVTGSAWTINGVFGNFIGSGFTNANWEIRSGVSAGNGGVLVASGTGATSQGPGGSAEIDGLNVTLQPGTYWLSIAPIVDIGYYVWLASTSGTNAVGTPAGNDDNSFTTWGNGAYYFSPASQPFGSPVDFSMGVVHSDAPEPGTFLLLGCGLLMTAGTLRRRRLRAADRACPAPISS